MGELWDAYCDYLRNMTVLYWARSVLHNNPLYIPEALECAVLLFIRYHDEGTYDLTALVERVQTCSRRRATSGARGNRQLQNLGKDKKAQM